LCWVALDSNKSTDVIIVANDPLALLLAAEFTEYCVGGYLFTLQFQAQTTDVTRKPI